MAKTKSELSVRLILTVTVISLSLSLGGDGTGGTSGPYEGEGDDGEDAQEGPSLEPRVFFQGGSTEITNIVVYSVTGFFTFFMGYFGWMFAQSIMEIVTGEKLPRDDF